MKLPWKAVLKILSDVLVAFVVLLAILLHGLPLIGLRPYAVLSGSMETVYPTGSVIYVKAVDPAKLAVGDTITFQTVGNILATHRIIELVPDEDDPSVVRFRTKGDENDIADGSLVAYDCVIGKPVFCIPLLGYLATYLSYPPGRYVGIAVAIALTLGELVISLVLEDKDKKNPQESQAKAKKKESA